MAEKKLYIGVGPHWTAPAEEVGAVYRQMAYPDFHRLFNPNRKALLDAMGHRSWKARELARYMGRDHSGLARDVRLLLKQGILCRTPDGNVQLAFNSLHVFMSCP